MVMALYIITCHGKAMVKVKEEISVSGVFKDKVEDLS